MTSTPSTFVAHDAHDVLQSLPTLFGFHVEESIVAVATYGDRRRFGFRLRIDLPPPESVDLEACRIASYLEQHEADGVVLVVLTNDQEVALDLLDAVHVELDEAGIEVVVRVRADGRRYWTDAADSPVEGVSYTPSDHHLSIVQAVAAGQQILPGRGTLVDRFAAVAGDRRIWLEHATGTIIDEVVPLIARSDPQRLGETGMSVVGPILDRLVAGGRVLDADLLRIAVWVSSVKVRDAVWARIDRDSAGDMLRVLTLVSGSVMPPFEPAVLSLTAFAAWLTGDGTQALIAVERALRADPDYSMARLVLDVLEHGMSPSHWTNFVDGGDGGDDRLSDGG